jgi:CubicO group peptidase (beta-lactamase class C family)
MKHPLLFLLLLSSFNASLAWAQDVQQEHVAATLALGQSLSDSLAVTDHHTYTIDLTADQFVYGEVNQQTVDVAVTVYAPNGEVVGLFHNSARGPEAFFFDTETDGQYRIEVRPFNKADKTEGDYTISLKRVEPVAATPAKRVDQLMASYDGKDVPGGVVAVIRDGEVVFSKAYGMANLTHSIPFTTETRSNIGSVSKQFTAFAIALLADQGKLSLDDDVRKHIPELPDFGKTVTLRNLLTHTCGFREFLTTLAMTGRRLLEGDYIGREELIAIVQRQPALQNDPGTEWNYNNTGFGLLTVVLERVTGQPFPAWMATNVFKPLGMHHTVVRTNPSQIVPNSAQGYLPSEEGGYREGRDLGAAMGAGGIYTTVGDLAKWMQHFQTPELGGADVMREMTTPYVLADGETTNYGLGLFLDEQSGLRRIHHGGADAAHRAMLMFYPEINAGVVTLSNNGSFGISTTFSIYAKVSEAFFEEYNQSKETKQNKEADTDSFDPAKYDPEAFDVLAGRYELDERPGFILTITREDNEFFAQATGQPKLKIEPTSDFTFTLTGVDARLTFRRGEDDTVQTLTLHQNGNHLARRLGEEVWQPTAKQLGAYAGRYYSVELDTFYSLAVEDSELVVQHRRLEDVTLTPTKEDAFGGGGFPIGELIFERGEAGRILGFTVSNDRTRDVRFERQD